MNAEIQLVGEDKMFMRFLILSGFLIVQTTFAQNLSDELGRPDLDNLKQEGQLFSVRISLGEPLRIFVAGKEEAKLDLSKLQLTVRRLDPYPGQILSVNKEGDFYTISDTGNFKSNKPTDLEVTTKVEGKKETFRFKLKNKPR